MKKLLCLLLVFTMLLGLTACGECDHEWEKATCEDPKTCSKCGETKGEPEDDHDWEEEDGVMVCSWCGEEKEEEDEDQGENETEEEGESIQMPTLGGDDQEEQEEIVVNGDNEILGSWLVEIALGEELTGVEGLYFEQLPMVFTFYNDGSVVLAFYEPYLEDTVLRIEKMMYDYLEATILDMIAEQGIDWETLETLFEETYGMSIHEYIMYSIESADMYNSLLAMEETYTYEFDGENLILDGIAMTVEIDGDELTITSCIDPDFWGEVGIELPVILRRVD